MAKSPSGPGISDERAQALASHLAGGDALQAASAAQYPLARFEDKPRFLVDERLDPDRPVSISEKVRNWSGAVWGELHNGLIVEQGHGLAFLLLPVALGVGAGFYYSMAREPAWQMVTAMLAVVCLLALLRSRRALRPLSDAVPVPLLAAVALVLLGMLAGRFEAGNATILLDTQLTTTITGRVLESQVDSTGHTRYLLQVISTTEPAIRRPPERVRLVARANHVRFAIGTLITGRAQLTPPSGPAYPGGYDFARNAYGQGIGAYGFYYSAPRADGKIAQAAGLWGNALAAVNRLRAAISERVRSAVPGDPGALIAALTVSDRSGITDATVDTLRATGLAHILAISGLHMALAAGTFFLALRKLAAFSPRLIETRAVKKYAALGAVLIATAYLVISGAGIPTRRAWLMMVVMFGAVIFDRQALTMRNVALAALMIIAISPFAVVTPGFQMSFAATAALIAAYDAWSRRDKSKRTGASSTSTTGSLSGGFARFAGGLAMTSLVAGLATGLFAAYHFHQFAAYGLITNLLAMPLVTFLVMPMGLVAMLAMPFGLDYWPLQAMGLALEVVVAIAGHVDAMGGDTVTGKMPLWPTIIAAGGFVALVFLRTRLRLLALVPLLGGLVLALPVFRPAPPAVLVSEDGRLVGLLDDSAIATNASRPGDFLFGQWQTAFRRPDHVAPETIARTLKAELADPYKLLAELAKLARASPGRFSCADRSTCMALTQGHMIAAIADPAFLGAGCDLSEIVVLSAAIRSDNCRSGANLITARHLKRSGAVAISFLNKENGNRLANRERGFSGDGARGPNPNSAFKIQAALDGTIRPWTIQRYFDWRSDRFDLPDPAAGRAALAKDDAERVKKARNKQASPNLIPEIRTPANQLSQTQPGVSNSQ